MTEPSSTALAEHALKLASFAAGKAEQECLLAARDARKAGMTADAIAAALGWSRSTLYRRMTEVGYWP